MASSTILDAIHGYYMHHSTKVTGMPKSHGCHRTTGIGALGFAKYTAKKRHKVVVGKLY